MSVAAVVHNSRTTLKLVSRPMSPTTDSSIGAAGMNKVAEYGVVLPLLLKCV